MPAASQLQILDAIVLLVAVDVVHRLMWLERAANAPGHDEPVLHNVAANLTHDGQWVVEGDANHSVTRNRFNAAAH